MKIERLELYGYKRLMLNNIKRFTYTPTASHQLILGTNGSGKSSVLSELSPLPGHHSNYSKDGFKKATVAHLGRTYQLNSSFSPNKHSFVVDGNELNPGGTYQAQLTLVLQHFGIDKDIHELLTGEVRLSQLPATERRKWITRISRADYGYAMGEFRKFASRARDQQGALKHLRSRLSAETHALQSMQDVEGLGERAQKLREELNHLMLERIPNLPSLETQKARLRALYAALVEQADEYFRNIVYLPKGRTYRSNEDVVFDLQRLDVGVQNNQSILQRMGNEFSDMESVLNSVKVDAGELLDNLPELIAQTHEEIRAALNAPVTFRELTSPSEIRRDWQAISTEVQMTFRGLPDNMDRRFSREAVQNTQMEIAKHQRTIEMSEAKIRQMQNRIEAMEEAKESQCPSCKYVWRPGFSDEEMTQLKTWQGEHGALIDNAKVQIKELEAFVEECGGYTELYQRFRGFVQGYPRLQPLWDHILTNQLLLDNPRGNLALFSQWAGDLEANVRHEEAVKRLNRYLEIQERQNNMGDTAHFTRRMHSLQSEIEQATVQLLQQREERGMVEKFYRKLQRVQEIALRMENDYNEIERIRGVLIDSLRNEVIDETVTAHQLELGGIVRRLSEKEGQEGIVRDIETSMGEVEIDAKAWQVLTNLLSPNEGLIAEQLASDIGCMVAQLNSIVSSIWTYEMTVLSCGLDSGELDYKFPVQFAASDNLSPDVAKTSKGQKQVIDFAFQLTVMLYLNLTDYPLFLDEPGEGFDEAHRVRLMDFVKQLMDSNRHSQLFMISHYASSHGSFTNAEVLVLDTSNIAVPGVYNQHVVLG
ncbi:hypothetical protein [Xanthomonas phage RTH11]|nr:hypothetical protein [Xanthomonas phage RTH11]